MKKKSIIFAVFKTKNIILILGCVAVFIATCSAVNAAIIGYQLLADCCTSKVSDCSWSNIGEDSLSCFKYFNFSSQMTKNKKNYSDANNSNIVVTSAHETCTKFISFISERYPQLNKIKFKLNKKRNYLSIRARYKRRAIHAQGFNIEETMNCFMRHLVRKLSLEKYYPTVEEMKAQKALEPFFVKFNCKLIQNII